jgi:hypothetical protein
MLLLQFMFYEIENEPMPIREVNAIRLMMYDETKHLTFDERNAYFSEGIDDICKEFSIKLVSLPEKDFADFGHTIKGRKKMFWDERSKNVYV